MRQVENVLYGKRVAGAAGAYAISRRDAVLLVLAVCLPVPLLSASGLAVPLPEIVQRVAASLVPFLSREEASSGVALNSGSILLAPGEPRVGASPIRAAAIGASSRVPDARPGTVTTAGSTAAPDAAVRERAPAAPAPRSARSLVAAPVAAETPVASPAAVPVSAAGEASSGGGGTGSVGGTGGAKQPVADVEPVPVSPVPVPVSVDPVVKPAADSTTVSVDATAPVVGDVTVAATVPVGGSGLPAAPLEGATAAVQGAVDSALRSGLGGLGGR